MAKPWYKSKTMWINALLAAGGVVIGTMENAGGYLASAAAIINIVLRKISREEIT